MTANEVLSVSPIVPVIAIDDAARAVDLAHALLEGGIGIMEITLRTADGLRAIEAVASHVKGMCVGAGTVLNFDQFERAEDAGAQFVISPGATPSLMHHASHKKIPFILGVATATEIMMAQEYGLDTFKLFPAEVVGGVNALKAFYGPFKSTRFCPTGGVNRSNLREYLAQPNVLCVGGTWIATPERIAKGEFAAITHDAKEALNLLKVQ